MARLNVNSAAQRRYNMLNVVYRTLSFQELEVFSNVSNTASIRI